METPTRRERILKLLKEKTEVNDRLKSNDYKDSSVMLKDLAKFEDLEKEISIQVGYLKTEPNYMNCDDCGEYKEVNQWRDTHFMICMECAVSPLRL